jgi:hypothetical protein
MNAGHAIGQGSLRNGVGVARKTIRRARIGQTGVGRQETTQRGSRHRGHTDRAADIGDRDALDNAASVELRSSRNAAQAGVLHALAALLPEPAGRGSGLWLLDLSNAGGRAEAGLHVYELAVGKTNVDARLAV